MTSLRDSLRAADPLARDLEAFEAHRQGIRRLVIDAATEPVAAEAPGRTHLRPVMATAMLVVVAILLAWRPWSRSDMAHAAVRFEVRLAEASPSPGLFRAQVTDSDRVIYLHNEVVISNGDVAWSRAEEEASPGFVVRVAFTPAGSTKMRQATRSHLGKPIAILLDGRVVMAPVIRAPIDEAAVITGPFSQAEAERVAQGIGQP